MSAAALLETLQRRGISARVECGDLKLKPVAALDSALIASLQRHKLELVQLLQVETASRENPTWKREAAKTALDVFREEAALCAVPHCPGLVRLTQHLVELWRAAEAETGETLTASGAPSTRANVPSLASITTFETVKSSVVADREKRKGECLRC